MIHSRLYTTVPMAVLMLCKKTHYDRKYDFCYVCTVHIISDNVTWFGPVDRLFFSCKISIYIDVQWSELDCETQSRQ